MHVGLTGNIGSGKSSLARMLGERGAAVVDADACARQLLDTNATVRQDLATAFGRDILDEEGQIRRSVLADRAFCDEAASQRLDELMRKPLEAAIWAAVDAARTDHDIVVLDAPLLFEWGIADRFDVVIVVTSSQETATHRLLERGVSQEQIERRRARQWPADRQAAAASIVVENDGSLARLKQQAQHVWDDLLVLLQSSQNINGIDERDPISD